MEKFLFYLNCESTDQVLVLERFLNQLELGILQRCRLPVANIRINKVAEFEFALIPKRQVDGDR